MRKIKFPVKFIIAGVVAVFIGLNSWTIVDDGTVKAKKWLGEYSQEVYPAGFHVVNPLASYPEMDIQQLTYNVPGLQVPSQDKLKTTMDLSIMYSFKGEMAPHIFRTFSNVETFENRVLLPTIRSVVRESGKSVKQSQDFFRDEIQREMQQFVQDGVSEIVAEHGLEVHHVMFRDINLPPLVLNAIEQTKIREEQKVREEANLKIKELQAQAVVKQAEANATAAIQDKQAAITRAEGEAESITKIATAQAKANKELAASVTPELIEYNEVNRWDGKRTLTHSLSGETQLLLK